MIQVRIAIKSLIPLNGGIKLLPEELYIDLKPIAGMETKMSQPSDLDLQSTEDYLMQRIRDLHRTIDELKSENQVTITKREQEILELKELLQKESASRLTLEQELSTLKKGLYIIHPQLNPRNLLIFPARTYVSMGLRTSTSKVYTPSELYNMYESYCDSTFQIAESSSDFEYALRTIYPLLYVTGTESCGLEPC